MQENIAIILTIPHAKCIGNNENHTCDAYAKKLADALENKLTKITKNIHIFIGNINRSKIDLNRIQSRVTPFRRKVIETAKKWLDSGIRELFVIDCHSFPVNVSGIYTFGTNEISKPQVTILYDQSTYNIDKKYADLLEKKFRDIGLKSTELKGIHNDIIDQFIQLKSNYTKIIPLLVEIREDLDKTQIDNVTTAILSWIKEISKK